MAVPPIEVLPPPKTLAPVSPSKAHSEVSASQTIASDVPSVVVTIGEPSEVFVPGAHQATAAVGFAVPTPGVILIETRFPPSEHPTPVPPP